MLDEGLGSHPLLCSGGELFNRWIDGDHFHVRWRAQQFQELYGLDQTQMVTAGRKAWKPNIDFTPYAKKVFETFNGFKLIYDHLPITDPALLYFKGLPDLKIIFVRRNPLEALVSFTLAIKTNNWQRREGEPAAEDEPIEVSAQDLKWFCDQMNKEDQYTEFFAMQSKMVVSYTDLTNCWGETNNKIQSFLELEPTSLPVKTLKRTEKRPRELIKNYQELFNSVKDTPYARCFPANLWL